MLGTYGPAGADRSGVVDYLNSVESVLGEHFTCHRVSNDSWRHPDSFDYVLYNLGANLLHECAFRALEARRGPLILHEHILNEYYVQRSAYGVDDEATRWLRRAVTQGDDTRASLMAAFEADHSLYYRDHAVERFAVARSTAVIVHSPFVRALLTCRYPGATVLVAPHPVPPFDRAAGVARRAELLEDAEDCLFGTFGFPGSHKRLLILEEAWRIYRDRGGGGKLLVVGSIPARSGGSDVVYRGFVPDFADFRALQAAVDVGIQLRHPTLGETSGAVSALLANGTRTVLSATEFTEHHEGEPFVYRVPIGPDEPAQLAALMGRLAAQPRDYRAYDEQYSPQSWTLAVHSAIRRQGCS